MNLEPAAGALIGLLFFNEPLSLWQWAGVLLIGVVAAGSSLTAPDDPGHQGPVEEAQALDCSDNLII
jgi:threonine/homoserine efflux transporter RhtA